MPCVYPNGSAVPRFRLTALAIGARSILGDISIKMVSFGIALANTPLLQVLWRPIMYRSPCLECVCNAQRGTNSSMSIDSEIGLLVCMLPISIITQWCEVNILRAGGSILIQGLFITPSTKSPKCRLQSIFKNSCLPCDVDLAFRSASHQPQQFMGCDWLVRQHVVEISTACSGEHAVDLCSVAVGEG